MEENEKNIDESWKEIADKEKEELKKNGLPLAPEPTFSFFITTLAIQASIFLGAIANPATNKIEEDLPQAKFLIDTLEMLQVKTKGNLDKEETDALENMLYELRMQYVNKIQKK